MADRARGWIPVFGAMVLTLGAVVVGCSVEPPEPSPPLAGFRVAPRVLQQIEALRVRHRAATLGIGVIRRGELVWTYHAGEQRPGVPAGTGTMFNTASVAKAVTAETFLRLAGKGIVDLDEPISRYYVHPDLVGDPRHEHLTPRIILTHRTGFLNWPASYDDGKLAFLHDPGERYGYSGVGFEILAEFLAAKCGVRFADLVRREVFDPLGMERSSVIQRAWMESHRVMPLNGDGDFLKAFDLGEGYWNAADDLFVSVEDYARFLIAVWRGDGLPEALRDERVRVQTDLTHDPVWGCDDGAVEPCPAPFGHGIGWFVLGYGDNLNVQHGGNDKSEAATGYFETATGDGMIVFVNAPNPEGVLLYPQIVDLLHPEQRWTRVFHHIIGKYFEGAED